MSKLFTHDADMVFFGTDAAEHMIGWEIIKESTQKQLAAFETTKGLIRDEIIKVHDSGKVAWFSGIMDWDVKVESQLVQLEELRVTGVMEKRNGQ